MKKLVITILFISIVAVINAATIYVYVHNVNGNLVYGANVKLYDEFWNYISTQYTNSSGLATFSLLDYGYYNYEVYYYGDANEFWGSDENFYLENTTITRQFWRNWPYLYNHSFSTTNPNVGEEVIIEITVKNNLSYSRSVKVELWIDRDQSSSWDFHETSSAQTVYGGSTRTFTFSMTPSSSGTYYWKSHIKTYNDGAGAYIVTDTYPWSDAFTAYEQEGDLDVYVYNINGNTVSGATVKLYDEYWNYLESDDTNSSGRADFDDLLYGTYNYEVYYESDATEFWGSEEDFEINSSNVTRYFTRNWPYLYNHSFSTTNPNVGEEVIIEITVKNNLSYSRSVKVELWIDRDQSSSWDFHETSSAQTVYGGSTRTFTFSMTPSSSGIYYWKSHIKTYNDGAGAYIVTDTYPWSDAFTVSSPPLPELDGIIAFHTYSGFFNYDGIIHILDLSNYSTTDLNFSDWEGCTNPNISPDGLKIVFMAVPHNEHQYNKFEILLYNLENGILSRLTNNSVADEDPKFSPNGHFIVFKRNNDLYKIEISSLDETQITSTLTVQEWAPFYSRYGSKIYYTLSENGNDDIWQIDSNGENAIPIIQGPNDEWYPQTISENSLFYILSDNGDDVYMYDFTSGISEYLITNSSSDDSDPFFISGNYFGFSSTKNYNGYDLYIGDVETGDTWKIYGNETLLDVLGGSYCYPTSIYPENEFFDDFTYTSVDDPELSNFQWYIRTEQGGPGFHCAQWKRDNISFITYPQNQDNILMKISAKTSGDSLNCEQGEIGQEQQRFYQGTYGSRVFFTDNPQYWDDLTVQAFFSINTNSSPQVYSECDFEYLAYDNNWWWGPGLYETTWEDENNKTTDYQSNIIEGWHVLLFQIYDDVVNYYIDGVKVATHNGIYYPESEMSIVFNHWFDTLLGNSSEQREHSMIVDWVYHAKDIDILTNQVETIIASFKMGSTQRYDSIGGIDIDDDLNINISSLQISQNYPNPFNLVTSFDYHLPKSGFVTINIYNVKGQKITTLMEGWQPIGNYSIKWNSINQSSGVYFYEVIFDDNSIINRCVLLQ